ncbi:MAG TPA: hypothetical protein VN517_08075 [Terriglobales bacterium]|nr:hypothetical protein [Terriglobales bacterium]
MDWKPILIETLLAGFFAVACLRAHPPFPEDSQLRLIDFFQLSGRIDRLRQSRWAWFSLVAFMLVLRLQQQLPLITEVVALCEFSIFMALPEYAPKRVRRG